MIDKISLRFKKPAEEPLRAFLLHPIYTNPNFFDPSLKSRDQNQHLAEGLSLLKASRFFPYGGDFVRIANPRSSTLLGSGATETWGSFFKFSEISLVVINTSLSPIQQRNLERLWKCKVIDRIGLILDIFSDRANTREGKLQVELASLKYQKSRLVKTWTHLERQRGGFGFLAGPGEKQLEIDKRLIEKRIQKLCLGLSSIKKTRALHRIARKRKSLPIVALVGYTNSGKSTLFNRLTESTVYVKDQLFATLDPTLRRIKLPSNRQIILSDTVGFISDLPIQLIAAFRATLEEVLEADLLLHVRDISSEESIPQAQDVILVLEELGIQPSELHKSIEVLNKIDVVTSPKKLHPFMADTWVPISALTGEGCEVLLNKINDYFGKEDSIYSFKLKPEEGKKRAWLHENGHVLECRIGKDAIEMKVQLSKRRFNEFQLY